MRAIAALLIVGVLLVLACGGDDKDQGGVPLTFKEAEGRLTVTGADSGSFDLQPAQDDTLFFGPPNIDETNASFEFSMRNAENTAWLQVNLYDVKGTRRYDDFRDGAGDGRITVTLGLSCNGAMGTLLADDCAWYSTDFASEGCAVTLTDITDDAIKGKIECRGVASNCTPDSDGQRDGSGVCLDRLRRPLIGLSANFELDQAVDVSTGASRSPRSVLR